jgi:hypothetical protein
LNLSSNFIQDEDLEQIGHRRVSGE